MYSNYNIYGFLGKPDVKC